MRKYSRILILRKGKGVGGDVTLSRFEFFNCVWEILSLFVPLSRSRGRAWKDLEV